MLADDDNLSIAVKRSLDVAMIFTPQSYYAAEERNSGTASSRTVLIMARSSSAIARSSAAIYFRNDAIDGSLGLVAIMPARPILTLGSCVANRISLSRPPGRIP
jgi:hypothetical protein